MWFIKLFIHVNLQNIIFVIYYVVGLFDMILKNNAVYTLNKYNIIIVSFNGRVIDIRSCQANWLGLNPRYTHFYNFTVYLSLVVLFYLFYSFSTSMTKVND